MVLFYPLKWEKESRKENIITVKVTGVDEYGNTAVYKKFYKEWIGVCTNNISKVIKCVETYFPSCKCYFKKLDDNLYKKVLPYFNQRLKTGKLRYSSKSFYKLYTQANISDVGFFFNKYKIAYYNVEDWLVRIYIDFGGDFYYKWYNVDPNQKFLLQSFKIDRECVKIPQINFAAFDFETVPLDGEDRVPTGHHFTDRIVMISIVKWNNLGYLEKFILYLNPTQQSSVKTQTMETNILEENSGENSKDIVKENSGENLMETDIVKENFMETDILKENSGENPTDILKENLMETDILKENSEENPTDILKENSGENPTDILKENSTDILKENIFDETIVREFFNELDMFHDFLNIIDNVHVLTGYNINQFDLPCIFARLIWLDARQLIFQFSSKQIGKYLIPTFKRKLVIDMYNFVDIFSSYDLPSLKLDDVAKHKLGEAKVPIKSIGIHNWYSNPIASKLLNCQDVKHCFNVIKPKNVKLEQFGTFRDYLKYCLQDSMLVYKLFLHEKAFDFLVERSNFTCLDVEESMYYGNSRYILYVLKTYGTLMGFFLNTHFLKKPENVVDKFKKFFSKDNTYQGALNYSLSGTFHKDVYVFDFASMYPSILLNQNLCYGTCTILTNLEYFELSKDIRNQCMAVPYRNHSDSDFLLHEHSDSDFLLHEHSSDNLNDHLHDNLHDNLNDNLHEHSSDNLNDNLNEHSSDNLNDNLNDNSSDNLNDNLNDNSSDNLNDLNSQYYHYPTIKPDDTAIIVWYKEEKGFLPTLCEHFLEKRAEEKKLYKQTGNVIHYNKQLNIKLLLNSIYGCMGSDNTSLSCLYIAMSITAFARMYLLASARFFLSKKCIVVNCDTDSVFVVGYPFKNAKEVNRFLNQLHMNLAFEQAMDYLLIISKKRYVYQKEEKIYFKGFEKKSSELVKRLSQYLVEKTFRALKKDSLSPGRGFKIWVNTLIQGYAACKDPKKYCITRKTRKLEEYKSKNCPQLKLLKQYPDLGGQYIDYTYSQADVKFNKETQWIMRVEDVEYVNFEKLISNQKKILCNILDIAFFNSSQSSKWLDNILNTMKWKNFLNAEFKHYCKTGEKILILVLKNVRYTFHM